MRVLPGDAALDVDRRRDKRLRPSVVVAALAAAQARPPKGKPETLLESLVSAYELLAAQEGRPDPVLRLDALWRVQTMLPGAARDYSKPEFARDLSARPEWDHHDPERACAALPCQQRHPRRRCADDRGQDRAAAALLGCVVQRRRGSPA